MDVCSDPHRGLDLERKPALDKRASGSGVTAELVQVLGNFFFFFQLVTLKI